MQYVKWYKQIELANNVWISRKQIDEHNFEYIPIRIEQPKAKEWYVVRYIKETDVRKYIRERKRERKAEFNKEKRNKQFEWILQKKTWKSVK